MPDQFIKTDTEPEEKKPNTETIAAMEDIKNNRNLTCYTSLDQMWKDLKTDDDSTSDHS